MSPARIVLLLVGLAIAVLCWGLYPLITGGAK